MSSMWFHTLLPALLMLSSSALTLASACSSDQLLPHEDCARFVQCSNGAAYVMQCAPGTLFDYQLQICNHASLVTCQPSTTRRPGISLPGTSGTSAPETPGLSAPGGFLPNGCPASEHEHLLLPHEDCAKFYQCVHGNKVEMPCAPGTLFDVELQVCNHAWAVTCTPTAESQEVTTPATPGPSTPETSGTSEPGTPGTSAQEGFLPNSCPASEHEHVLLPHEDCSKFYQCVHGNKVEMPCAPGTLFDVEHQVCNWPDQVTCGSQTSVTSNPAVPTIPENLTTEPTTTDVTIDSLEVTSPETTTDDSEETTEKYEVTTSEVTTDNFEATTDSIEVTTLNSEETTEKYEVTTPEVTTDNFEATTDSIEVTTLNSEETTEKYEVTTSEVTTNSFEATTDGTEVTTPNSEETTEKYEVTTSEVTTNSFEATTDSIEVTTFNPEVTSESPEVNNSIEVTTTDGYETSVEVTTIDNTVENQTSNETTIETTEYEDNTEYTTKPDIEEPVTEEDSSEWVTETVEEETVTLNPESAETSTEPYVTEEDTVTKPNSSNETDNSEEEITPEPNDTESTTEWTNLEPATEVICPIGFIGPVANPEDCGSYYMCSNGIRIPLFCAHGYKYDHESGRCAHAEEGPCAIIEDSQEKTTETNESSNDLEEKEEDTTTDSYSLVTEDLSPEVITEATSEEKNETTTLEPENSEVEESEQSDERLETTTETQSYEIEETTNPMSNITLEPVEIVTASVTTDEDTNNTEENTSLEENASVVATTEPNGSSTTEAPLCPSGFFGNVAHPADCGSYFLCSSGIAIPLFCAEGSKYDSGKDRCVTATSGPCSTTVSEITPEITNQSDESLETTTETQSYETEDTTVQIPASNIILEPAFVEIVTESDEDTNNTEESVTTDEVTTSSEDSVVATTEPNGFSTTEAPLCPSGFFGNVANPADCGSYFLCSSGIAIPLFCAEGSKYDSGKDRCVTATSGPCFITNTSEEEVTESYESTTDPSNTEEENLTEKESTETTTDAITSFEETSQSTSLEEEISEITPEVSNQSDESLEPTTETQSYGSDETTVQIPASNIILEPAFVEIVTESDEDTNNTEESLTTDEVTTSSEDSVVATTEPNGFSTTEAPLCPSGFFGNVANPTDCGSYFLCSSGIAIPLFCAEGSKYDSGKDICVTATSGPCFITNTSEEEATESYESTTDPSNTEEENLTEEESTETTTDAITSFEETSQSTSLEEEISEITTEVSNQPDESLEPTTETQSYGSDETTDQIPESNIILEPAFVEILTESDEDTNSTEESVTTDEVTTSSEDSVVATTEPNGSSITEAPLCPSGFFGNVANPSDCGSYFLCSSGIAIPLFCAAGSKYDSGKDRCIAATNGPCAITNQGLEETTETYESKNLSDTEEKHSTELSSETLEDDSSESAKVTDSSKEVIEETTEEYKSDEVVDSNVTLKPETTAIEEQNSSTATSEEDNSESNPESNIFGITTDDSSQESKEVTQSHEVTTEESGLGISVEPICPVGFFGNVANKEECGYFMCSNGIVIPLFCAVGSEYDIGKDRCVPATEGPCAIDIESKEETTESKTEEVVTDEPSSEDKKEDKAEPKESDENINVDNDSPESPTDVTTTEFNTEGQENSMTGQNSSEQNSIEQDGFEISSESTTQDPICPVGFFGNAANPKDCGSYFMCSNGIEIPLYCADGHKYDNERGRCITATDGPCALSLAESKEDSNESYNDTPSADNNQTEGSSSKENALKRDRTEIATEDNIAEVPKENSLEFDLELPEANAEVTAIVSSEQTHLLNSNEESSSETVSEEQSSEKTNEDVSSEELSEEEAPLCPIGVFMNVAHPEDCDSYYMCSGGIAIQLFCPVGSEFDTVSKACVPIADTGCTNHKSRNAITNASKETETANNDLFNHQEFNTKEEENTHGDIETDLCKTGLYSTIPHQDLDNSYFLCVGGMSIQLYCNNGYVYDVTKDGCVVAG